MVYIFLVVNDSSNKDILYHGKILSDFFDNIYLIFCNTKTAFELWDALEYKHGTLKRGLDFQKVFLSNS